MASSSIATPTMIFQAHVTRVFGALGGRAAAVSGHSSPADADWFDDDVDAPAAADADMATARDRCCRANYPLGVTG